MTPVKKPAAPPTAAGYSMASLPAKLGFHPNERVGLVNEPPGFEALLEPVPKGVRSMRAAEASASSGFGFRATKPSFAVTFRSASSFSARAASRVCWPKKSSSRAEKAERETSGSRTGTHDDDAAKPATAPSKVIGQPPARPPSAAANPKDIAWNSPAAARYDGLRPLRSADGILKNGAAPPTPY
jgi:hypothetical protein